jgi:flagellar basal body-associated protein FliL
MRMLRKVRMTMAVKRLSSIIAILLVMAIGGFMVICSMTYADAMVEPSESEETAKAAADHSGSMDAAESEKSKEKSKSDEGTSKSSSESDDDVVKENAFTTPGNANLGDYIKSSGKKDFYTIRTENDHTYYLVIDHAGNMDNVYMLSAIDENDLKDFLEEDDGGSGAVVLPEKDVTEEPAAEAEVPEEKEPEKNRTSGIISLVLLMAAGGAGFVLYKRYRINSEEPEEDYSENMEGDGLETVNEDEEFWEEG